MKTVEDTVYLVRHTNSTIYGIFIDYELADKAREQLENKWDYYLEAWVVQRSLLNENI